MKIASCPFSVSGSPTTRAAWAAWCPAGRYASHSPCSHTHSPGCLRASVQNSYQRPLICASVLVLVLTTGSTSRPSQQSWAGWDVGSVSHSCALLLCVFADRVSMCVELPKTRLPDAGSRRREILIWHYRTVHHRTRLFLSCFFHVESTKIGAVVYPFRLLFLLHTPVSFPLPYINKISVWFVYQQAFVFECVWSLRKSDRTVSSKRAFVGLRSGPTMQHLYLSSPLLHFLLTLTFGL